MTENIAMYAHIGFVGNTSPQRTRISSRLYALDVLGSKVSGVVSD